MESIKATELAHSLCGKNARFFKNKLDNSAYDQYGCQCYSGWEQLILSLSQDIINHCDVNSMTVPRIIQIKQKVNRLVVYLETANSDILSIIDEYSEKSMRTCEMCAASLAIDNTGSIVHLGMCTNSSQQK